MSYHEWRPPIPSVDSAWILTVDRRSMPHYHVLADGRIDLLYRGTLQTDGMISMTDILAIHPAHPGGLVALEPGAVFVGLRFRSGWGASFPADLSAIDASGLGDAKNVMAIFRRPAPAAQIVQQMLAFAEARVVTPSSRARDIIAALDEMRSANISEIAYALSLSARTLRRDVRAAFGCSPKQLERVRRFQRALRACSLTEVDLAQVAVTCGFADQSHMTNEFAHFAGMTPLRAVSLAAFSNRR